MSIGQIRGRIQGSGFWRWQRSRECRRFRGGGQPFNAELELNANGEVILHYAQPGGPAGSKKA
ncbi:MAG TPA: hypothetical protein VKI65_01890 [Gemmataceae bacterium]|nr:hypothetical protein [Gemmataceae bacterium]